MGRLHHGAVLLASNIAQSVLTLLRGSQNRVHKTMQLSRVLGLLQSVLVSVNGHIMVSVVSSFLGGPIEGSAMSCQFYSKYLIVLKTSGGFPTILDLLSRT